MITLETLIALVILTALPAARSALRVLVSVVFFVGPTIVKRYRVPAGKTSLPLFRAWTCT